VPLWPTRQEPNHPYRGVEIEIESFEGKAKVKFEDNRIRFEAVLQSKTDSGNTNEQGQGEIHRKAPSSTIDLSNILSYFLTALIFTLDLDKPEMKLGSFLVNKFV
jgi:hypothetical protein